MKPPLAREWLAPSRRTGQFLSVREVHYSTTERAIEIALVWIDEEGRTRRRLSSAIVLPSSEGDPLLEALLAAPPSTAPEPAS